jgi:hypothetical protein
MATIRGYQAHWIRNIQNLTRPEIKYFLLHDAHGREMLRDTGADIEVLTDHLVEASNKRNEDNTLDASSINKREADMREHFDIVTFSKRIVADGESAISEAQATSLIKQYSDANRKPGEKSSVAFARIFGGDDDIGLNFRKMVQIAKGIAHPHVGA